MPLDLPYTDWASLSPLTEAIEAAHKPVVIALDGKEFAYVADGGLRGMERPKRKRLKHLFVTEETISGLQSRLEAGGAVENHELRKWLAAYRQKEE